MAVAMGFGNDFVADHIEHRAGGKSQAPRQQHFRNLDRKDADQTTDGFNQAGRQGDQEGRQLRISLPAQRHSDGQPLRGVLQPDPGRQRHSVGDVAAAKADANGHTFGKVVNRDCDDEQPDLGQSQRIASLAPFDEMFMRQHFVHHGDGDRTQGDPTSRDQGGDCHAAMLIRRRVDPRHDKREIGGRQHHTGSEAQ